MESWGGFCTEISICNIYIYIWHIGNLLFHLLKLLMYCNLCIYVFVGSECGAGQLQCTYVQRHHIYVRVCVCVCLN